LIDDEARHFSNFRGIGVLFSAPHNLNETTYERVVNWQDVRRKFLGLRTTVNLGTKWGQSQTAASRSEGQIQDCKHKLAGQD
jgi:hypothetical protein